MLIPGSTGTKRGTDSFWLRHTGTLRFPSSSCSPGRGSFPVPCARLQTEAVRVTATGGADFPSSSTLSLAQWVCRRWQQLQQGSGKIEQIPSSRPFSKHSKAEMSMRKDKGEKGREPRVARKLEGAWLSAGVGESTQTGLDFWMTSSSMNWSQQFQHIHCLQWRQHGIPCSEARGQAAVFILQSAGKKQTSILHPCCQGGKPFHISYVFAQPLGREVIVLAAVTPPHRRI